MSECVSVTQPQVHTMLAVIALLCAGAVLTKANLTKCLFPNPTQYKTARYPKILLTTEELQEVKSVQPKGTCLTLWQVRSFVSNGRQQRLTAFSLADGFKIPVMQYLVVQADTMGTTFPLHFNPENYVCFFS